MWWKHRNLPESQGWAGQRPRSTHLFALPVAACITKSRVPVVQMRMATGMIEHIPRTQLHLHRRHRTTEKDHMSHMRCALLNSIYVMPILIYETCWICALCVCAARSTFGFIVLFRICGMEKIWFLSLLFIYFLDSRTCALEHLGFI